MRSSKKTVFFRVVAFCLLLTLTVPCYAKAATPDTMQPYASNYLDMYNTYICAMGSGKLEIWYTVVADTTMDEIGVLSIILYESSNKTNWTRVKTYSHENYSSMLIEDDWAYSSCVSYNGTVGKYYKAYVCIWAGKNGSGDTRYMWTPIERAT